uniref:PD-(D/E)XK endonuclease-like domain-containing protein n=1 Tax=Thermodesulfobacterium geofontis TaxID=1295609 RepID=A0A7V4N3W7_9BACT
MVLKLNQSKVSLRLLKEKSDSIILGEILHNIWELLLIHRENIFSLPSNSEELKSKIETYIKKALASYQEPLSQRKYLLERAFDIIEKMLKSEEFKKFGELFKKDEVLAIYREPEGFFAEENQIQDLRPDLIIKKRDEWIILEFKLHGEFEESQLERYFSLLKKVFPNDNIKAYLVSFEPFKIELKYLKYCEISKPNEPSSSHPTQLSLFKNLN